jgi:hypothetical protein
MEIAEKWQFQRQKLIAVSFSTSGFVSKRCFEIIPMNIGIPLRVPQCIPQPLFSQLTCGYDCATYFEIGQYKSSNSNILN